MGSLVIGVYTRSCDHGSCRAEREQDEERKQGLPAVRQCCTQACLAQQSFTLYLSSDSETDSRYLGFISKRLIAPKTSCVVGHVHSLFRRCGSTAPTLHKGDSMYVQIYVYVHVHTCIDSIDVTRNRFQTRVSRSRSRGTPGSWQLPTAGARASKWNHE